MNLSVELHSGNASQVKRGSWFPVSCRRPCWGGLFVFGAFSSHLYRSHTVVLVLAVSGVQLAEFTVWSENSAGSCYETRVFFLLIRRLPWTHAGAELGSVWEAAAGVTGAERGNVLVDWSTFKLTNHNNSNVCPAAGVLLKKTSCRGILNVFLLLCVDGRVRDDVAFVSWVAACLRCCFTSGGRFFYLFFCFCLHIAAGGD